jgi:hypothetical protein
MPLSSAITFYCFGSLGFGTCHASAFCSVIFFSSFQERSAIFLCTECLTDLRVCGLMHACRIIVADQIIRILTSLHDVWDVVTRGKCGITLNSPSSGLAIIVVLNS